MFAVVTEVSVADYGDGNSDDGRLAMIDVRCATRRVLIDILRFGGAGGWLWWTARGVRVNTRKGFNHYGGAGREVCRKGGGL